MWKRVGVGRMVPGSDLRAVEPVQSVGGGDPKEPFVILKEVVDRVAAEAIFCSELPDGMR